MVNKSETKHIIIGSNTKAGLMAFGWILAVFSIWAFLGCSSTPKEGPNALRYRFDNGSRISAAAAFLDSSQESVVVVGTDRGELAVSSDDGSGWNPIIYPRDRDSPVTDILHADGHLFWITRNGVYSLELSSGTVSDLEYPSDSDSAAYPVFVQSHNSANLRLDLYVVSSEIGSQRHTLWGRSGVTGDWIQEVFDSPDEAELRIVYPPNDRTSSSRNPVLGAFRSVYERDQFGGVWKLLASEAAASEGYVFVFPRFHLAQRWISADPGGRRPTKLYSGNADYIELPFALSTYNTSCTKSGYGSGCPVPIIFSGDFDNNLTAFVVGEGLGSNDNLAVDNTVFITKDAGQSWTAISPVIDHEITELALVEAASGTSILVFGESQILRSDDMGLTWQSVLIGAAAN